MYAIFGFLSAFNCTYRANDRIMTGIRTKQRQRKEIPKKRQGEWQNNDRDKDKTMDKQ
jgi:hypothetical protein